MPWSYQRTYEPRRDIPDLKGKVTGGNAGIGFYTVAELVKHGAKVYMGARNESRATGAIAQLKAEGFLDGIIGQVIWHRLDLSTPKSTRAGAEAFLKRETRLDILVNNAGLGGSPENFELVDAKVPISAIMSTNHLGPFVLTNILLPLITKTAAEPDSDVRIVTVSSSSHKYFPTKVNWKSFEKWNMKAGSFPKNMSQYGTTKLANILFAKELQRRLDHNDVNAVSITLHPGEMDTELTNKVLRPWALTRVLHVILRHIGWFITSHEGSFTQLFAATSSMVAADREKYKGAYLTPFAILTDASTEASDLVAARDLWETSERIVQAM
ncbi:hypothetical protein FRB94_004053 [Tulasnella sp. JGI-2019a]|nr:hypothetical protein FRB94_004053 [Tulasnella sp. JGI-2019a]